MTASYAIANLDENDRREFWAALALRHCPRLGNTSAKRLLERFGSAYSAVQQVDNWGEPDLDLHPSIHGSMRRDLWREKARVEWDAAHTLRGEIILWTDERYPADLREIPDAPLFLYVRGDVSLLHNPSLAVVGTRNCSSRGAHNAKILAGGLAAAGITVVSGLALGVDGVAHRTALSLPGRTIAVLGTGLDRYYPSAHSQLHKEVAEHGLLVSEFAPGTDSSRHNFPTRNRIISGLSLGVLVVEASLRSGSLNTAYHGIQQNRAVYAVAGELGNLGSEGCHKLIREGAQVVFCSGDILRDLSALLKGRQDERMAIILPEDASHQASSFSGISDAELESEQISKSSAIPEVSVQKPSTIRTSTEPVAHVVQAAPVAKKIAAQRETPLGQRLILALTDGPKSIDTLCEQMAVPVSTLSAELVMMEVLGNIKLLPNNTYSLL